MSGEDRLTRLEMLAAEQERMIEELSGQLAAQWKEIEALRTKVDVLARRLVAMEEQSAPDIPATRPPHW